MTLRPALLLLCLPSIVAAAETAPDRWSIEKALTLGAGETANVAGMTSGNLRLESGAKAQRVHLDNGDLRLDAGSEVGEVFIGNGTSELRGKVTGDVTCGVGELRLKRTVEVSGNIINLSCTLDIDPDARIAGDIVSYGDINRFGPALTIPGKIALLPGLDRRTSVRDFPEVELRKDTRIEGGLWLDHCVQITAAPSATFALHGISPHDPLKMSDPKQAACARFPGQQGNVHRAALPGPTNLYLFRGPKDTSGMSLGDFTIVHYGIELRAGSRSGAVRTINGAVVVHRDASVGSLDLVNGAVVVRTGARVEGPVTVGNGPLVMEAGSSIGGDVRVMTASIELGKDARIDGSVTHYGGTVVLPAGASVGSLRFAHAEDRRVESEFRRTTLKIDSAESIRGPLVLERAIVIKVRRGPAPAFTGVTPEIKLSKR